MYLKKTAVAVSPVTIAEASSFLKLGSSNADVDNVRPMIDAATTHAETFMARDVRVGTYELLTTDFGDEFSGGNICLRVAQVATITSVEYLVSDVWTTVDAADYSLVSYLSESYVRLHDDKAWPTDGDEVPHNVRVIFTTEAIVQLDLVKAGILKHIGAIHADRGDAEEAEQISDSIGASHTATLETAKQSGAEGVYGPLALPRF